MRIGLGIGLNRYRKVGGPVIAEGDPFESITPVGQYDSVESAQTDGASSGDYFTTTSDNVYGLPESILMRVPTFTSYSSATAGYNAVGGNVVFELSQNNAQGYPFGTSMITYPAAAYNNDTEAGIGGVQVNDLYALNDFNFGKLIKQRTA